MTVGVSICTLCELHNMDDMGNAVCAAFPNGIPPEIAHQGFDHRNEFTDDNGIRFVPKKGVTPEKVDRLLALRPAPEAGVSSDDRHLDIQP